MGIGRTTIVLFTWLALGSSTVSAQAPSPVDINVALMESTFMVRGPAIGGGTIGTVFLMAKPVSGPENAGSIVLITANHVLKDMQGEYATILLRKKRQESDWVTVQARFRIRNGVRPLWSHPTDLDIAAMYLALPTELLPRLISTADLADDDVLKKYEMGPGVELDCLGYPLGNDSGTSGSFPILRSGKIASYPLLPTSGNKTFLFDFRVFKGNSGGPVYFAQTKFRGGVSFGPGAQFLMGLVVEERVLPVVVSELYEVRQTNYPLSIGIVVHASFIRRLIESLPSVNSPEGELVRSTAEVLP